MRLLRQILGLAAAVLLATTGTTAANRSAGPDTGKGSAGTEVHGTTEEAAPALRFRADGRFRILQLTDLHFTAMEHQSAHVPEMIRRVIEWERPDLIVVTGDLIYARGAEKLLRRITGVMAKAGVPYAISLGNHDAEQDLTRNELYEIIRTLPGCINGRYNTPTERQGDFVIPIATADGTACAARIYVMDSNDYNADDHTYAGVSASQVAWYEERSEADAKRYGATLPSLLFLHIPLNEYATAYANDPQAVGFRLEAECPGRDNHGLFAALVRHGDVMGVFAGHDHANNYVAQLDGIALGYGRYSGGYAEYQELLHGARIIELKQGERGFTTWERLANGREARRAQFPHR